MRNPAAAARPPAPTRRRAYRALCSATCASSAERRGHRRLHRAGTIMPACLRTSSSCGQRRIPGHEPGPVAGQVRALGQRVHGEQPVVGVAADRRVQHRDRLAVPAELEVALVAGQHAPRSRAHSTALRSAAAAAPGRSGWPAS